MRDTIWKLYLMEYNSYFKTDIKDIVLRRTCESLHLRKLQLALWVL